MTIRYCPRCKTDVEDTGGYCLLGHRLALEPPAASITDLRAEVDRAFEEARLEVASVLTSDDVPTAPMTAVTPVSSAPAPPASPAVAPAVPTVAPAEVEARPRRVPPPPPPPRRPTSPPAAPQAQAVAPTPIAPPSQRRDSQPVSSPAPQSAPVQPQHVSSPPSSQSAPVQPPPVPTTEELRARSASVWKDLDSEIDIVGDPIGAFAPPPHMDWGPDKGKMLKRKPSRRSPRDAEATE